MALYPNYPNYQNFNQNFQPQYAQGGYLQPQYANPQPNNNGFYVNEFKIATEEEAKAYIVNPNCRVVFMDTDAMSLTIKTADPFGKSNSKSYKLVDKESLTENNSNKTITTEFDPKEFVKTADLKGFASGEELKTSISGLESLISKKIEDLKLQYDKKLDDFKKSMISKLLNDGEK